MWSTIYYILGAGTLSSIGYGLLYYFDKPRALQLSGDVTWKTVRLYHKMNLEYSRLKRIYCVDEKESKSDDENDDFDDLDNLDENKIEFLGYNMKNSHITKYSTFEIENNEWINNNEFDLMFLKKTENELELYKRIMDKKIINKDIEIDKVNKPFLQIELFLNDNDDNVSIHKNLEKFYVNENKILDKKFLTWYSKIFYDITIDDNYKLNIIDSDINMFNIGKNDFLKLNKKENGKNYEVISQ